MVQSLLFKILLAPISLLYGLGVSLRNFFYEHGVLREVEFNLPLISVGNLSVGGAGKTPHIEYLIRQLKDYIYVATLSRGYKRKTKGYLVVQPGNNASQVGDEPLQFKRKFSDVMVSVAESRTFAIPKILMEKPETQVVLLDDAFQHRAIKPGLNILLTEYNHPFTRDYLLPSGRLREWRSAYRRADIIIVSKCPRYLSPEDRNRFRTEIEPLPRQRLYFSYYKYLTPYYFQDPEFTIQLTEEMNVLLISAIARTNYLLEYLEEKCDNVRVIEYEDHHDFTRFDLSNLQTQFNRFEVENKIILTTEKDAMRLEMHRDFIMSNNLPIYVLPIEVAFHEDDGEAFNEDVRSFLLNFKT